MNMDEIEDPFTELETAVRMYTVATENLLALFEKYEERDIPLSIKSGLMQLAMAINAEWGVL